MTRRDDTTDREDAFVTKAAAVQTGLSRGELDNRKRYRRGKKGKRTRAGREKVVVKMMNESSTWSGRDGIGWVRSLGWGEKKTRAERAGKEKERGKPRPHPSIK